MITKFNKIDSVNGELKLPGDKSISHRAVMFSSLADGRSTVTNYLNSADVNSTIGIFRKLGVEIEQTEDKLIITGRGINGLTKPDGDLDAGNSGTTARLMSGILAVQPFESRLIGDESLSKRPMGRVIVPLSFMGAQIDSRGENKLPLVFTPARQLFAIDYELPVASAQVKSAVLLAGMFQEQNTIVIENELTRDHTEKMLGLRTEMVSGKKYIYVNRNNYPVSRDYVVPSDISTSAFFLVLGSCLQNSELRLKNVSLNETRDGIIRHLKKMGADITIENEYNIGGEIAGDIIVKSSELTNCDIDESIIPNLIDEIPVLSVAGLLAKGAFRVKNAGELRVKECDRIKALCENYKKLGLDVTEYEDGFEIEGFIRNRNVVFESFDDHRIAMTFAVFSLIVYGNFAVDNFECIRISNPDFIEQINLVKS